MKFLLIGVITASFFPAAGILASASAPSEAELLREAQRGFDRSLSILNTTASLIGVLITLIAIILVFGGFELFKWRRLREEAEKSRGEATKCAQGAKDALKEMTPILEKIKEAERDVENFRQKASTPLAESLSIEDKGKIEDIAKKVDFLEMFGLPLKAKDYLSRASDFYYKGKYEEALKAHEKAIELKPDDAMAWSNKSVILNELGRYEEALKASEKAIELKPDYANAWTCKGATLFALGRYEEALKAHEKAIELQPDFADAWANKGGALSKLARNEEALNACEKAIELKPDDAMAWSNKGATLSKLGRYEEALKAHETAIELKPDYAMAWFNKACVYALKAEKGNALRDLSEAIRLDAKNKEMAKKDEDFKGLHGDKDFERLVS